MDLKRSHAEAAKHHMNVAIKMLNCGRIEEAKTAFERANDQLDRIIDDEAAEIVKTEVFGWGPEGNPYDVDSQWTDTELEE